MSEKTRAAASHKTRISESFALYALFVLCVACALLLCVLPRPLAPDDLPALRLPRAAVAAVLAQDVHDQKRAPKIPAALELERLFLEAGEAEALANEDPVTATARMNALRNAYSLLVQQAGNSAAVAMRARELSKLEAAFELRLPDEQVKGVMGSFANALHAHGATARGEEVVPHFVVRTLYKVRWNRMMGVASDSAFADIEKLAYHGFLALHAGNLTTTQRIKALDAYAALSPPSRAAHVAEAHGVLLFLAHQPDAAAAALHVAYDKTGNLKLRNYALGAETVASSGATPEESQEKAPKPAP